MSADPEKQLCESWSIGRLRPWLQMVAERELPARLRGRLEASDVVQQALVKAWQGESDFAGSTHEERLAWLRTVLKNTIRDQQRRLLGTQKRGGNREYLATELAQDDDVGVEAVANDPTVSHALIAQEESKQLSQLLSLLPDDQRRVIQLRHVDGLSHDSTAQRLGKSSAAVRMMWVRALRNLRRLSLEQRES